MKKNILIPFLLIATISGCNMMNRHDLKSYLGDIGVELKDDYQTLSLEQTGFKDFTLNATLIVSNDDKAAILKSLKTQVKFIKIDTIPLLGFNGNATNGYLNKSTYYFYKGQTKEGIPWQEYELKIDTANNRLDFEWGDY
ncbi:hypothetical protein ACFQZI_13895 [Mucilaginibacter lutimaris]|uniref:Lipoprotein n=1 Tax=Mucilaginibacter lutimaris TaxID=931629 RepID=A0ABW2ZIA0_9SPHI